MQNRKVLDSKYLPKRLPITFTMVNIAFGKIFFYPSWPWGAVIAILSIFWILCIVALATEDEVTPQELIK